MNTEAEQHEIATQVRPDDKPNRHEYVRQQVSHKGLKTGIAAGLLALLGLSAWLLA